MLHSFESLNLPSHLVRAVHALNFSQPTDIQSRTIPVILTGKDVAIQAETGAGKTAAFVLPTLARMERTSGVGLTTGIQVLTIVPTRELAIQVSEVFRSLARFSPSPPPTMTIIGGASIDAQMDTLQWPVSIIVATPGRLLDLLDRGAVDLSQVHTLILDEADKLLNGAFSDEVAPILESVPTTRQCLLLSATLPEKVMALSEGLQKEPTVFKQDEVLMPIDAIEQRVYQVDSDQRRGLLQHFLTENAWTQVLVFVASQRATENLARKLSGAGFSARPLHGGLAQKERGHALNDFKSKTVRILVATDIAARGIDIPKLDAVVNFDLPRSTDVYIHRVGRTGRAGATGIAISFVDHKTESHFRLIESRNKFRLPRERVEGFELTGEPLEQKKGAPPKKGRRKSKKDKRREKALRDGP